MDQLWAPWRFSYVAAPKTLPQENACFICDGLSNDNDRENLIFMRKPLSVGLLNRFPYNNGHLLIATRAHKSRLAELTSAEMLETMESITKMVGLMDQLMHPEGYNIGLNLGQVAGAGLPGHLHWHVVPRWNGDTNFMPVLTDTKVMVQSLDALWEILSSRLTTTQA